MSQFVVSARKYRPTRFSEVVGQSHVSQTLRNALQSDHLAHAFLFCGPRGVGKTTNARILAKILNCTNRDEDYEACGKCDSCKAFEQNASFNVVELDAASNNSVEAIRGLIEQVRFAPQQGKYKVFIIDEVHMLSTAAFNAFLKTLEEPPSYAIFILATTEKHKIIPTILSRCQIFDFKRIQVPDTVAHLQKICTEEGIAAEAEALHVIAQKADGALRDALSIFDRIVSASGKKLQYSDVIENLNVLDYDYFFRVTDAVLSESIADVMNIFDDVLKKGFDADLFVNGLAEHFRNLLVSKDIQTLQLIEAGDSLRNRYKTQAQLAPVGFLLTALNICNDCDVNFKTARNKRLHVEMSLLKMAHINRAMEITQNPAVAVPATNIVQNIQEKKTELVNTSPTISPNIAKSNAAEIVIMPQLGSLSSLAQIVEQEVKILEATVSTLSADNLLESWKKYTLSIESPTIKMTLENAILVLEEAEKGGKIIVKVGTAFAVGVVQGEVMSLLNFLKFDLNSPDLILQIVHDESFAPVIENPNPTSVRRYLSPREKLKSMMQVNPLVKDFVVQLGLQPDE